MCLLSSISIIFSCVGPAYRIMFSCVFPPLVQSCSCVSVLSIPIMSSCSHYFPIMLSCDYPSPSQSCQLCLPSPYIYIMIYLNHILMHLYPLHSNYCSQLFTPLHSHHVLICLSTSQQVHMCLPLSIPIMFSAV